MRRLTMAASVFDFGLRRSRRRGRSYAAARLVLVGTMLMREAAREYDVSQQAVSKAIKVIESDWKRDRTCAYCGHPLQSRAELI